MKILITNDDGIQAVGLKLLTQKAMQYGEVFVIAPLVEQSAKSHSINIKHGLDLKQIHDLVPGVKTYTVDSTPADCVRVAKYYLKRDFDIVFSGINNGYNVGEDIMYSGTVAGASEAVFDNKKGIAFSATYKNLTEIDKWFDTIMAYFMQHDLLNQAMLYNVNVPLEAQGIKLTHQGSTHFAAYFDLEEDLIYQKGRPNFAQDSHQIDSDVSALYNHFISITPLTNDRTDYKALNKLFEKETLKKT